MFIEALFAETFWKSKMLHDYVVRRKSKYVSDIIILFYLHNSKHQQAIFHTGQGNKVQGL